jgi:hypothetical protein
MRRFAGFRPSSWAGTRFDWGFAALASVLVGAGYLLANPAVHEVDGDHFICVKRPDVFNAALMAACTSCAGR